MPMFKSHKSVFKQTKNKETEGMISVAVIARLYWGFLLGKLSPAIKLIMKDTIGENTYFDNVTSA